MSNQKIISSKNIVKHSIIIRNGKPFAIITADTNDRLYYFNPYYGNEKQKYIVTETILENALSSLLRTNIAGFEIVCMCFYGLKQQEEYFAVARKVYKEFFNELYNMTIADDIFKRERDFKNLSTEYDFFEEKE